MIEKIIDYCVKKKFLVLVLLALLSAWGFQSLQRTPLDAIPNLSDVQVIVFTEWPGKSPDIIEDQITYPIVSNMVAGVMGNRLVRIPMASEMALATAAMGGTSGTSPTPRTPNGWPLLATSTMTVSIMGRSRLVGIR